MSAHNHDFMLRTAADTPILDLTRSPVKCQRSATKKRVDYEGRVFFVGKDEEGRPVNIMERKLRADGRFSASTYWHRSHRLGDNGRGPRLKNRKRDGTGKSLVVTVLELAGVDIRQIAGS